MNTGRTTRGRSRQLNDAIIKTESEESALSEPARQDKDVTFKSRLYQFRHEADGGRSESLQFATSRPATYKSGRKRPLSDNDAEAASDLAESLSSSKSKKQQLSSKYAPPSKYAHLPKLLDVLEPGLICVFVGLNPGIRTATAGHAYAHPSNHFWKLLHSSGCTDERLKPEQDVDLPRLYSMGNTNIVERPSKDQAELTKAEIAAGTPVLEEKIRRFRPEAICIVGKGIWEAIWRWKHKREIRKDEFRYGWQHEGERMGKDENREGARVFVASSTSGLSASLKPHEKEEIWRPFGEWVKTRRLERLEAGADG